VQQLKPVFTRHENIQQYGGKLLLRTQVIQDLISVLGEMHAITMMAERNF